MNMQNVHIQIERAHRTGPRMRFAGKEGPRAVMVRLHNYTDGERILYAARNKGTIEVDGGNVSFYEDFSGSGEEEEGVDERPQIVERSWD